MARLTNPAVQAVGVSVNTSQVPGDQRQALLDRLSEETGLPCVDPIIDGVQPIIDRLLTSFSITKAPIKLNQLQTKPTDGEIA